MAPAATTPHSATGCPVCRCRPVDRIGGKWCPRCQGWIVEYRKPEGATTAFISRPL